jgi:hypothetical protein
VALDGPHGVDKIHWMRWFLAVVIILVLVALDRAYMRGENARLVMSIGRDIGAAINRKADELLARLKK